MLLLLVLLFFWLAPGLYTIALATCLSTLAGVLVAGYCPLSSATQIGQYNAAVKISDFIAMPLFSLNTMFAPTIAELYSRGEVQKLATMYQVVNKWIVTLSLPIFCIAALFSQSLLQLSGRSFQFAWPLLVVSAVGSMIHAATGSVGYMLLKWT